MPLEKPSPENFDRRELAQPNCLVTFYNETGYPIETVEVFSAVPKITAVSNAKAEHPELAARAASVAYIGPVKKKK